MSDYYFANGVSPGSGSVTDLLDPSSLCTLPANPDHGDYSACVLSL